LARGSSRKSEEVTQLTLSTDLWGEVQKESPSQANSLPRFLVFQPIEKRMPIYTLAEAQLGQIHRIPSMCIVVTDIAGFLIAVHLARAGQRVIVVESGVERFEARI
jgi:hypothetical protein